MTSMRTFILASLLILFAASAYAQMLSGQKADLKGFTVTGFDTYDQPWSVSGAKTNSDGTIITISQRCQVDYVLTRKARATDDPATVTDGYSHTPVRLESQGCTLNMLTKELTSSTPVTITIGNAIVLTSVGYYVNLETQTLLGLSQIKLNAKDVPVSSSKPSAQEN